MVYTTIHVTFTEKATGRMLGQSDLPLDRLPASFEASTTLHIGGQDWHVESAEPLTADAFARMGELKLTVSKIAYVDPRKILFTLPTLDAASPQPDPRIAASEYGTLQLHEDGWRQIEYISARYANEIEAELADIQTIVREQSVDNGSFLGFRAIHMRRRIPSPLHAPIPLGDARAAFAVADGPPLAVSFERMPGVVPSSYAYRVGELALYGVGDANSARCLCVHRHDVSLSDSALSRLQGFMSAHGLYLVDWCRMTVFTPNDAASLVRYFSGR